MTERIPEFQIEIVIHDSPKLSEREQTTQRILDSVDSSQYSEAQELVDESGISYSEAVNSTAQSE